MSGVLQDRVNKREFIARVSARTGWPVKVVASVYEGIVGEIIESVCSDEYVVLSGFGQFYRQMHKGHKVSFGRAAVDDYAVLKFSASRVVKRMLAAEDYVDDTDAIEGLLQRQRLSA